MSLQAAAGLRGVTLVELPQQPTSHVADVACPVLSVKSGISRPKDGAGNGLVIVTVLVTISRLFSSERRRRHTQSPENTDLFSLSITCFNNVLSKELSVQHLRLTPLRKVLCRFISQQLRCQQSTLFECSVGSVIHMSLTEGHPSCFQLGAMTAELP